MGETESIDTRRPRLSTVTRFVLIAGLVYAVAWAAGNGGILAASWLARGAAGDAPAQIDGINHFQRVDDRVWRGGRPSAASYQALAAAGVRTVVDLRAGDHVARASTAARDAGIEVVRVPLQDGTAPTDAEVARFVEVVQSSDGPVFVHCNAGVGRTGSIVASYLVATGQERGPAALWRSLAVGPPSLEQVAYMARLRPAEAAPGVPAAIVAVSRAIDAPRHLLHLLRR